MCFILVLPDSGYFGNPIYYRNGFRTYKSCFNKVNRRGKKEYQNVDKLNKKYKRNKKLKHEKNYPIILILSHNCFSFIPESTNKEKVASFYFRIGENAVYKVKRIQFDSIIKTLNQIKSLWGAKQ